MGDAATGRRIVRGIAVYRIGVVLARGFVFMANWPLLLTANTFHFVFNIAVVVGLFCGVRAAGYALAAVLVALELQWLWVTVRGFSVFTQDTWEYGATEVVPFTMDFLRNITLMRGVFFISVAALVVYAFCFSPHVKAYYKSCFDRG